jgi:ubiquinone/menaquinone biosynthesis C-methylase UbiE
MTPIMGAVDLNRRCIERIMADVAGSSVLDAGCGRGYMIARLARADAGRTCVGVDINPPDLPDRPVNLTFERGWLGRLPFAAGSFDTVICTHTLEHILELDAAVAELRRIARRRLILVVPREREGRYAFNLHVHFFPYLHSFLNRIGAPAGRSECTLVDGDIYYREDLD